MLGNRGKLDSPEAGCSDMFRVKMLNEAEILKGSHMSNENSSANRTCRAFVVIVFVMVVCVFLFVIGMSELPSTGIRRHFSTATRATNR